MGAVDVVEQWGAPHAAAATVERAGHRTQAGDPAHRFRLASVTKLLTAYAVLIAVEEGTVTLDQPAGPPGSTVRHLLAHASGLPFDHSGPPVGVSEPVGARRVYSNVGYETLADTVEQAAAMPFATYLRDAVLAPLGMTSTALEGSAAADAWGTLDDMTRFAAELLTPTLLAAETFEAATTVAFPGLAGVLPGVGRFDPNDWGLGFELRDAKQPHWTGSRNSPDTFGHFGGSGTFLWVDPRAALGCIALTDREFGPWALEAWPALSDAVLES